MVPIILSSIWECCARQGARPHVVAGPLDAKPVSCRLVTTPSMSWQLVPLPIGRSSRQRILRHHLFVHTIESRVGSSSPRLAVT